MNIVSDKSAGWILAAAIGYLVLFAGGVSFVALLQGAGGDADDPVVVAHGAELYAQHCASCHGANLEGQPNWEVKRADNTYPAPPADETGHFFEHSDRQLFEVLKFGGVRFARPGVVSNMPAFDDQLSSSDMWAIIAYIKSTWPAETQKFQREQGLFQGVHLH